MTVNSRKVHEGVQYIKKLKMEKGFEVVDAHVHPVDVMGVISHDECCTDGSVSTIVEKDYFTKGLLEFFEYGKIIILFSPLYYKIIPQSVHKIIKKTFRRLGTKRLLEEMDCAGIDVSILVPIMPWSSFLKLREIHSGNRFRYLYSPDIHNIDNAKLREELSLVKKMGAIGIKLHPNLQDFYPQPSKNKREVMEKLKSIYAFAENEKMFLLFHGGRSFYTDVVNSKYGKQSRSRDQGLLNNFINEDNTSEVFSYNFPVIIAHLGSFAVFNDDLHIARRITNHYPNVLFDTAGCSPRLIRKAIEMLSSSRIIFGSDSLYNRMVYSIYFVYQATRNLEDEDQDVALQNILSTNIQKVVTLKVQ